MHLYYFSTYSPPIFRHILYHGTNFCRPSLMNGATRVPSQLTPSMNSSLALGNQPDLHLGEMMVVTQHQVWRVVKNHPLELLKHSFGVSCDVKLCIMQKNNTLHEYPMPFVLDRPSKLFQHCRINFWCHCGPWFHKFYHRNSLVVPKHCSHHFLVR